MSFFSVNSQAAHVKNGSDVEQVQEAVSTYWLTGS